MRKAFDWQRSRIFVLEMSTRNISGWGGAVKELPVRKANISDIYHPIV
jgi:hypothetical protein